MTKPAVKTRVLLVDDQKLFVESLKIVLETESDTIQVIGIAYNADSAIQFVREREKPDIILMDVRMPEKDGVEATRVIKGEFPEIKIIMLTTFDDDVYVQNALKWGAVGYLLKNMSPTELTMSIEAVNSGALLIAPEIAYKLVRNAEPQTLADGEPGSDAHKMIEKVRQLSPREKEILRLVAQGFGNRQIVERLHLAEQTVRNQISTIYAKLEVHERYDAIQVALKTGLTK
ncbi:MAG: response regulator transcription factor [Treponemataceae bacterium]